MSPSLSWPLVASALVRRNLIGQAWSPDTPVTGLHLTPQQPFGRIGACNLCQIFRLGSFPTLPQNLNITPIRLAADSQSHLFCVLHDAHPSSASKRDIVSNCLRIRFERPVQPSAGVEKLERCRLAGNFQAMFRDALRDVAAAEPRKS